VVALEGRWRPILLTAIFTGLRASELRGLRWQDIDFVKRELHVRQRADRFSVIGAPKSESGERAVPLTPMVMNALREWKLVCPKSRFGLVFPSAGGLVEHHTNIVKRGLAPAMVAAGVTTIKQGQDGQDIALPKYTGLHALRHFYASWMINRRADGGLELPPKVVQERMGHSSIVMTMDIYGHLFPRGDDSAELAEGERALLA
jgi:integrase